jgi:hypothetical protein
VLLGEPPVLLLLLLLVVMGLMSNSRGVSRWT